MLVGTKLHVYFMSVSLYSIEGTRALVAFENSGQRMRNAKEVFTLSFWVKEQRVIKREVILEPSLASYI